MSENNSSSNSKLSSIDNILDVTSREATAKEDDYILHDFQINNEAIDTTSGNIENATYDKGSSSVPISKTDTVVDKEKASNRQPIAVATVVVGSGAVGSGAFFFLKRKRILEKILKKWI